MLAKLLDEKHNRSYIRGMNKLPLAKRVQILSMLCEGSSMRSISRVADVSINTVYKLLAEAGPVCTRFHDATVRGVASQRIQCDEAWAFCYAKQKNVATAKAAPEGAGDVWTWTALDADSKLILSWAVGGRDAGYALALMDDLAGPDHHAGAAHHGWTSGLSGSGRGSVRRRYRLRHAGEAVRRGDRRPRSRAQIQPVRMHWRSQGDDHRQPRSEARQHELHGAAQSDHADEHASVHPVDQCVQQEGRQPLPRAGALFRVLQFRSPASDLARVARDGGGISDRLWSMEDIVALIDAAEGEPKKRGTYKPRQPKSGAEISN